MNVLSKGQKIVSILLKIVVIISAIVGTTLSALASASTFMGGETVFMYFTIQSNILVAIISLVGMIFILKGKVDNKIWYTVKLVGTVSITLTGAVYCFVLAPFIENAWHLASILCHAVVPLASIIDFFVVCNVTKVRKINALWVTVPPLLYAIYSGIGYALDWKFTAQGHNYPYFFLNWGSEAGAAGFSSAPPFMGPVWWILILFVFLIIVGLVYLWIADLIIKKTRNNIEA